MPFYKKLVGASCYLSPCAPEDAENWAAWFNDLEITIPLGDEAYTPTSLEREGEMIDEINRNLDHVFTVVDLETEQPIGRCLLFAIDQINRNGMLGIVIGEKEYWGRGYGQEAVSLLLDYAFNLLNLNSIMLGVLDFNERAIRCYEKIGFKEIGRRRQARIIGGRKCDAVLMDILAEEFESICVTRFIE